MEIVGHESPQLEHTADGLSINNVKRLNSFYDETKNLKPEMGERSFTVHMPSTLSTVKATPEAVRDLVSSALKNNLASKGNESILECHTNPKSLEDKRVIWDSSRYHNNEHRITLEGWLRQRIPIREQAEITKEERHSIGMTLDHSVITTEEQSISV